MFLLNPDEQRRLLATGPAQTTAAPAAATTQNHARAKRRQRIDVRITGGASMQHRDAKLGDTIAMALSAFWRDSP